MQTPSKADPNPAHLQYRWAELIAAFFFALIGAIVVFDSFRTGFKWTAEGPQPGLFPFYIGCAMILAAAWIALQTLLTWRADGGRAVFAQRSEFNLVLRMFLPICVYVAGVVYVGIYVASIIYITLFMRLEGKFSWVKSLLVSVGVAVFLWCMFEVWFLVSLPKGPLETMLGF
jgi:putative tricarboxylic transport membrane protein